MGNVVSKIEIDSDALVFCYRLGLLHDDDHIDHELWLWLLTAGMQINYGLLIWAGRADSARAIGWIVGLITIPIGRAAFLRNRRIKRRDAWFRVRDRAQQVMDAESYRHLQDAQNRA